MFWNEYPYTDFHELNLDWILAAIMKLHHDFDEFKAVNEITNAGAWDITKQYQAWTIVSDNNMGYISLKPVPAGVAITNTDYWGLVADYDILITDLSQRISDLESDNVSNKARIQTLEDKMDIIEDLSGKKVLIIGDSIGDTSALSLQPNYVTYLKADLEALGATVTNNSVSGRCIASGLTPEGGLVEAIATVTGTYDYIIVELGINDWANQATLSALNTAFNTFEAWHVSDQQSAIVYWITPLSGEPDNTKIPIAYYRDVIMFRAAAYCYKLIDAYSASPIYHGNNGTLRTRWTYNGDGVHPNPAYAPYFAEFVKQAFLAGGSPINQMGAVEYRSTGLTLNGADVVAYYKPGGEIYLFCYNQASYAPGTTVKSLGRCPAWMYPFANTTQHGFTNWDIVVRDDGYCYFVCANGSATYTDVGFNMTYTCLNNVIAMLS